VARIRELGLADKAFFFGFDEIHTPARFETLKNCFSFFKEAYPDIRTATTGRDPSCGLNTGVDGVVDIWCLLLNAYDHAMAEAARARGKEVWWYICMNPQHPYPNWFIEYPAIEARLIWWMMYHYNVTGLHLWDTTCWRGNKQPIRADGCNKTDWSPVSFSIYHGDGQIICAGPDGPLTTVRLENIRDGIEDHELLTMLARKLHDDGAASRALCSSLFSSVTDFSKDVEKFAEVRLRLLNLLAERP
jgi:hypothetical protein